MRTGIVRPRGPFSLRRASRRSGSRPSSTCWCASSKPTLERPHERGGGTTPDSGAVVELPDRGGTTTGPLGGADVRRGGGRRGRERDRPDAVGAAGAAVRRGRPVPF